MNSVLAGDDQPQINQLSDQVGGQSLLVSSCWYTKQRKTCLLSAACSCAWRGQSACRV